MHKTLLFPYIFFMLSLASPCWAQNLVPDPGFEIFTENCVGYPALEHWFNPNTASPDLYSIDGCGNILTDEFVNQAEVPGIPAEGQAFVGMYCCEVEFATFQTRDYLSIQLTEFLIEGQVYEVSFELTRRTLCNLAIDKIGIYFSESPPLTDSFVVMDVEPQIETSGTVLTPELDWMTIVDQYVASGNERYLTIGNFREYDEMIVQNTGSSWKNWDVAYYLFDNVQVNKPVSIQDQEFSNFEILVMQDHIQISSKSSSYLEIYSSNGSLIKQSILNSGFNSFYINDLSRGIYLLKLTDNDRHLIKKIWKE